METRELDSVHHEISFVVTINNEFHWCWMLVAVDENLSRFPLILFSWMYGVSRKESKLKALNEKNKSNNIEKGVLPMPLAITHPSNDVELKVNENSVMDGIRNRAFEGDEKEEDQDQDNKVINEAIEIVKELPTIHVESFRLWYLLFFIYF